MFSQTKLKAARAALKVARTACSLHASHRERPDLRASLDAAAEALAAPDATAALEPARRAQGIVDELGKRSGPDPALSRGPPQTGRGAGYAPVTPAPRAAVAGLVQAIEALTA